MFDGVAEYGPRAFAACVAKYGEPKLLDGERVLPEGPRGTFRPTDSQLVSWAISRTVPQGHAGGNISAAHVAVPQQVVQPLVAQPAGGAIGRWCDRWKPPQPAGGAACGAGDSRQVESQQVVAPAGGPRYLGEDGCMHALFEPVRQPPVVVAGRVVRDAGVDDAVAVDEPIGANALTFPDDLLSAENSGSDDEDASAGVAATPASGGAFPPAGFHTVWGMPLERTQERPVAGGATHYQNPPYGGGNVVDYVQAVAPHPVQALARALTLGPEAGQEQVARDLRDEIHAEIGHQQLRDAILRLGLVVQPREDEDEDVAAAGTGPAGSAN
ncbi:hypothetical protein CYMTET_11650 [Cymbomonas tetramitiformis]|uniref:Uncharacterized protein n=1 Tax=Cymbomonas tetramitiformis TaxID=36881 RepID=A0AAE0F086_9CHLO|nr:hypothetical protein CYMTET_43183 [Cymbomonas tetramitiformis]KAK3280511.1 hypothetical protein CYMTET_11650 [Cymbomonas tetramitiformis]